MHVFLPETRDNWARVCWRENVFSGEECDRIIQLATNGQKQDATVGGSVGNQELRNSEITWIPSVPESEWLYQKLSDAVMNVNNERYKFELSGFTDDLQYTEYELSGHYTWHQDFAKGAFSVRKLSMSVLLSDPDDYNGGELELFGEDERFPQGRGTVLFFPSFEFHRVAPVTRGVRKTLVAWAVGPVFR